MGAGARGKKLENERKKEAQHKLGGFEGEGEEGAVEKRKRPASEAGHTARKKQRGEEVRG
jgi:hypothetical protein